MKNTKQIVADVFDVLKRSTLVAKLMMKRSIMERTRKYKFQRLGELTYSLYKTGLIKHESLSELVLDIDEVNKEIRTSSGEMDNFIR